MGIRIVHGNGDLIGAAAQGVSQGVENFQKGQLANREMADREAQTKAYQQRIADAARFNDAKIQAELDEEERKQREKRAKSNAALGMVQSEVSGLSQNQFWTKDDEAALRAIYRDPDLDPEFKQEAMDAHLGSVAERIAAQELGNERMKLRDTVMRMAQPDETGAVYLQPDEAQLWLDEIEASDTPNRIRQDLRKVVSSAVSAAGVERQMGQAMSLIDTALQSGTLNDSQESELELLKESLLLGDVKPSVAKFQARTIANGDGEALREFSQLIAKNAAAQGGQGAGAPGSTQALGSDAAGADKADAAQVDMATVESFMEFQASLSRNTSVEQRAKAIEKWAQDNGTTPEQLIEQVRQAKREAEFRAAGTRSMLTGGSGFGGYEEPGTTIATERQGAVSSKLLQ